MKRRLISILSLCACVLISFTAITGAYYSRTITLSGIGKLEIPTGTPEPTEEPGSYYPGADSLIKQIRGSVIQLDTMKAEIVAMVGDKEYIGMASRLASDITSLVSAGHTRTEEQAVYGELAWTYHSDIIKQYNEYLDLNRSSALMGWNRGDWLIGSPINVNPNADGNAEQAYAMLATYDPNASYNANQQEVFQRAYNKLVSVRDNMLIQLNDGIQFYEGAVSGMEEIERIYNVMVGMFDELVSVRDGNWVSQFDGNSIMSIPAIIPEVEQPTSPDQGTAAPPIPSPEAPATGDTGAINAITVPIVDPVQTSKPTPTEAPVETAKPTPTPAPLPAPPPPPPQAPPAENSGVEPAIEAAIIPRAVD